MGSIIITPSEPGYVSYADVDGGPSRFSRAFFEVMTNAMLSPQLKNWPEGLVSVKTNTENLARLYRQMPEDHYTGR